ncbi:hypothetical protein CR513_37782, partial [Mucuna pruriens]
MNIATAPSRSKDIRSSHSMKVQHQMKLIISQGQKNHDPTLTLKEQRSLGIVLGVSHNQVWGNSRKKNLIGIL